MTSTRAAAPAPAPASASSAAHDPLSSLLLPCAVHVDNIPPPPGLTRASAASRAASCNSSISSTGTGTRSPSPDNCLGPCSCHGPTSALSGLSGGAGSGVSGGRHSPNFDALIIEFQSSRYHFGRGGTEWKRKSQSTQQWWSCSRRFGRCVYWTD